MDLGLKGLLAKTEANINDSSNFTSTPQPNHTTSADTLNSRETSKKSSSDATSFPHVPSASPSPEKRSSRNTQNNNNPQDTPEDASNISGSLADWNFKGDGSENDNTSRPRTTQSRGGSGSGSGSGTRNNNNNNGNNYEQKNNSHQNNNNNSTHIRGGLRGSKSTGGNGFNMNQQFHANSNHRPNTVSELTQPRDTLGNSSLKMSPFGVRSQSQISEAERLCSDDNVLSSWLMKGGVQRAVSELGMSITELKTRNIKSFSREPGRPMIVPFHIQELRYNHFLLRRIEKIATVLVKLKKKKQMDLQRVNAGGGGKEAIDVSGVFERTIASERRRLAKIDKSRHKVVQVKVKDNLYLIQRRRNYRKKVGIEAKRQEVVKRRTVIQKRHLRQRAKKRERESKRTRDLVQKKHEDALLLAAENLRIKDIEATEKKRLYDIAKRKENNKADSVAKKREQIKERAKILVEQRRDNAELAANESKGRLARMNKEKEELRSAQRELQKLHKRDREEMVNRQRQARLHEQDTAQASHAKWLERTAMLNEIETAVRNERQRHAKEHRIQEFHRRENNKYERDILPGPGEYHLIDRWGQGRGATKISDANPKSDVDWAIHRAKNLPGPGAYNMDSRPSTTGVNFAGKKPKSDVDWMIYRASKIPGPGEYSPSPVAKRGSLKFSEFTPKSEIDLVISRAQDVPSPQDYAKKDLRPVRQKSLHEIRNSLGSTVDVLLFASKLKGKMRSSASRASAAKGNKLHKTM